MFSQYIQKIKDTILDALNPYYQIAANAFFRVKHNIETLDWYKIKGVISFAVGDFPVIYGFKLALWVLWGHLALSLLLVAAQTYWLYKYTCEFVKHLTATQHDEHFTTKWNFEVFHATVQAYSADMVFLFDKASGLLANVFGKLSTMVNTMLYGPISNTLVNSISDKSSTSTMMQRMPTMDDSLNRAVVAAADLGLPVMDYMKALFLQEQYDARSSESECMPLATCKM